MRSFSNRILRTATAFAVAFVVCTGCSRKLKEAEKLVLSEVPTQKIANMFAVQTKNGVVLQRLEAPVMEKYERDTCNWDAFPDGLSAYMYTEDGLLETIIRTDYARHVTGGNRRSTKEIWEAYGNVFIHNVIKCQTLETDTLYWNRNDGKIYTDAYVRLYSPDGMMQGRGMESDDRARNSELLNPFDSFGYAVQDSSKVAIDTVNFIGPLQ